MKIAITGKGGTGKTSVATGLAYIFRKQGKKIIAIDAGHLCQNLYLSCESIGVGTCGIGAYDQDKVDSLLGVDGVDEFTIYIAPTGKI